MEHTGPENDKNRIFILLTHSGTILSRLIRLFTGCAYSHAAISVDGPAGPYYAFGRLFPDRPLPGGFVREYPDKGLYARKPWARCLLLALNARPENIETARSIIQGMWMDRDRYAYGISGVIACGLNIDYEPPGKYFCSRFVAEILERSNSLDLPKHPALMRPQDFEHIPELRPVYRGSVSGLCVRARNRKRKRGGKLAAETG